MASVSQSVRRVSCSFCVRRDEKKGWYARGGSDALSILMEEGSVVVEIQDDCFLTSRVVVGVLFAGPLLPLSNLQNLLRTHRMILLNTQFTLIPTAFRLSLSLVFLSPMRPCHRPKHTNACNKSIGTYSYCQHSRFPQAHHYHPLSTQSSRTNPNTTAQTHTLTPPNCCALNSRSHIDGISNFSTRYVVDVCQMRSMSRMSAAIDDSV